MRVLIGIIILQSCLLGVAVVAIAQDGHRRKLFDSLPAIDNPHPSPRWDHHYQEYFYDNEEGEGFVCLREHCPLHRINI